MDKKIKLILISLSILAILAICWVLFFAKDAGEKESFLKEQKPKCPKIVLGVVSDIHAGSEKIRETETGNHTYPKRYKEFFSVFLDEMQEARANLLLTVGDNTHTGSARFAEDLKKMTDERNLETIWTKGNHDKTSTDVMSVFGVKKDYYYTVDKCDWRFVILNSCEEDASSIGGIGEAQMEWLKESLKTDKNVIISMHHSIWDKDTKEFIYSKYEEFEKIVSASGRVRYVFSGHTHIDDFSKIHNGVDYRAIPALSLGKDEKYSYGKKVFSLE